MSKINFTIDITDEMLDDAVQQLVKGKIREAVNAEIERQLKPALERIIQQRVRGVYDSLNSRFSWGTENRKKLDEKIINAISELVVSKEDVQKRIDFILKPIQDYSVNKVSELERFINEKCEQVNKQYISQMTEGLNGLMQTTFGTVFGKYMGECSEGGNPDDERKQ